MKINEGYKEKGKGRKCNETNEEKDSRMVDDSRTGAQCGDSAYAGEGGRGGCGTVWLFDIFLLQIVYLYLVGIFAL